MSAQPLPKHDAKLEVHLIEKSKSGDSTALNTLLEMHYQRIAILCQRLTGNPTDGADATQEALLAIVRGIAKFEFQSSFSTWSYRVATNAALDEMRRRSRRPIPSEQPLLETQLAPNLGHEPELLHDFEVALASIPEEFRAPLVLKDLYGFEYHEIAVLCGVPIGTVRSRISRGRARIAPLLGGVTETAKANSTQIEAEVSENSASGGNQPSTATRQRFNHD